MSKSWPNGLSAKSSRTPMTDSFQIHIDTWLSSVSGSEYERRSVAAVRVLVADRVATRVDDLGARTVRENAYLSAYHMAYWLAENWWRLRWEPEGGRVDSDWRMSHCLAAANHGYIWPPLTFASDGESIRMTMDAEPGPDGISPVRYLERLSETIAAADFEHTVDGFIEMVIARLRDLGMRDGDLQRLWAEVRRERRDPQTARQRRLEALLGSDPDEADPDLLEQIDRYGERFGVYAIDEIAAASGGAILDDLEAIDNSRRRAGKLLKLEQRDELSRAFNGIQAGNQLPWQRGEHLANQARAAWGLETGPVPSRRLGEVAGASEALLTEATNSGLGRVVDAAGFRASDNPEGFSMLIRSQHPTGRRFQFARLLADQIVAGAEESLLPATKAKTARQKLQRSFAAELLCPYAELEGMLPASPDDEDIEQAARHFDVSPLLVKSSLVNKGAMGRDRVDRMA